VLIISSVVDNNDSLAPDFEVNEAFFDQKVKEFVFKYNYTLNPEGVYDAIKYMYTYWPDPHNVTHIREQYINVSFAAYLRKENYRQF
jgi:neuroligin